MQPLPPSPDWLTLATEFDLGPCPFHQRPVSIVAKDQRDGSRKWALKMQEWVLGKDGDFHWEPQPSSRTDEYLALTRFTTKEECYAFWLANVTEAVQLKIE